MTVRRDPGTAQVEFDPEMERGGMADETLADAAALQRNPLSPDSVAQSLRRGWWIILAVILLALLVASVQTARQEPLFRASTTLVVMPAPETRDTADILKTLETLERRTVVATFSKIPSAPETRTAAGNTLGLVEDQLRRYRIQGAVMPNTNIIRIDVEGPERETVADLANAAALVTEREARELYRIYAMKMLAEATPPGRPVHPDKRRNYLVALVVGTLAGVVAAVAYGLVASRFRPVR